MFNLKGKRALITGSTQGIGFAIAEILAKCGATVYIHGATSIDKCRAAADKINGSIPVCQSLTEKDGADKLYSIVGDVDILVLNASIQYRKAWSEITQDELEAQMQTNFASSLRLIQLCAPAMKEKSWGRIVTIGSIQQYKPHKDMLVYAASKAAQMNMVQNLAKQLAPFGITVNNLSPGVIATPRNNAALADPDYAPKVLSGIPMGYAGDSSDLAGAALLLSSDEGRYITGIDLTVDGGMKL